MSENLKTKYFSDEDKIHALIAERDQIIQTLATERDKFGKRETELMARVERLETARLKAKAGFTRIWNEVTDPYDITPKRLNAIIEKIAKQHFRALQALRDGEGKAYPVRNGPDTANEGIGVPPKNGEGKA